MFQKGRKHGTVSFSIRPAQGASNVFLAGDFTDWQPVAMRRRRDVFSVTVPVPPGTHEYKFIAEGRWRIDPDHSDWAVNSYGTVNSVVTVNGEGHGVAAPGNR